MEKNFTDLSLSVIVRQLLDLYVSIVVNRVRVLCCVTVFSLLHCEC